MTNTGYALVPSPFRRLAAAAATVLTLAIGVAAASPASAALPCGCTSSAPPIVYAREVADSGGTEIFWMAATGGSQTRVTNSPGFDGMPSWSPSRTQIAFTSGRDSGPGSLNFEVYVTDTSGANVRRLTNHPATDQDPAWSPTSNRIVFSSNRDGNVELYAVNADGSGLQRLTNNTFGDSQPAWSPDGTKIVFVSDRGGAGTRNLFVMNADGSGVRRLTTFAGFDEHPAWSADGATIAFSRELGGNAEIHTVPANPPTNQATAFSVRRVTFRDGYDGDPTWSPDGRIAYASATAGGGSDIRVIRADGSGDAALSTSADWEGTPEWGRVPAPVATQ